MDATTRAVQEGLATKLEGTGGVAEFRQRLLNCLQTKCQGAIHKCRRKSCRDAKMKSEARKQLRPFLDAMRQRPELKDRCHNQCKQLVNTRLRRNPSGNPQVEYDRCYPECIAASSVYSEEYKGKYEAILHSITSSCVSSKCADVVGACVQKSCS